MSTYFLFATNKHKHYKQNFTSKVKKNTDDVFAKDKLYLRGEKLLSLSFEVRVIKLTSLAYYPVRTV